MNKTRLEAFSDGVIAIIITIMVLELKAPAGSDLPALLSLTPIFLSYVLSFLYLGIYWNNHHHMLQATERVHGGVLWANLHLLFWLSIIPFTTQWMEQSHFAFLPTAVYGCILLLAAIAYHVLQLAILLHKDANPKLRAAVGKHIKGKLSIVLYAAGIGLSFVNVWLAIGLYLFVALMWIVPDRRIEKKFELN